MLIFLVALLVLVPVLIFFAIGIILVLHRKRLGIIYIVTSVFWIASLILLYFFNSYANSLILGIPTGLLSAIAAILTKRNDTNFNGHTWFLALLVFSIILCAIISYGSLFDALSVREHTVYVPYQVEITAHNINVSYDCDAILPETIIPEKVKEMQQSGQTHYEGKLRIVYYCRNLIFSNFHENCTCTSNKLCDKCRNNIVSTKVYED